MQFNRDASGRMTPLPRPSIDTGMGLERIAAVLQGKLSSWETDLFAPLIARVGELAGKRYGAGEDDDVSMRVIADHGRTATFLIADGVTPSNEWRGYVLRRIMRRAMRHGRMLGLTEPFLWKTVSWVGERDGRGLSRGRGRAGADRGGGARRGGALRRDARQRHAADRGVRRPQPRKARAASTASFLFTLYDTYGFPRDLAEEILQDHGWAVTDETSSACEAEMEAQRERARAGATFDAADGTESGARSTSGSAPRSRPSQFVGYESLTSPAQHPGARPRHPAGARGRRGRRGRGDPRSHAGLRRVRRADGRHRLAGRPAGPRRDRRHLLPRSPSSSCTA